MNIMMTERRLRLSLFYMPLKAKENKDNEDIEEHHDNRAYGNRIDIAFLMLP